MKIGPFEDLYLFILTKLQSQPTSTALGLQVLYVLCQQWANIIQLQEDKYIAKRTIGTGSLFIVCL